MQEPKINHALTHYSMVTDLFGSRVQIGFYTKHGFNCIRSADDMDRAVQIVNQLHVAELIAAMKNLSAVIDQTIRFSALDACKPFLIKRRSDLDRAILRYNRQMDHADIVEDIRENMLPMVHEILSRRKLAIEKTAILLHDKFRSFLIANGEPVSN